MENILKKLNRGSWVKFCVHYVIAVWPRQKDARGENTKINYGSDTAGEKERRKPKKNVDGRSTSSHDI
jgi:hypothetical protein